MKAQWTATRVRGHCLQWVAPVAVGLGVFGCLPGDDRPEPGSIYVTAEPTVATADGFSTSDGWAVRFDRFVTALGDIRLHNESGEDGGGFSGGSCTEYAETHYDWLFDFTVAGREKIGLVFGLGTCSVEWSFRPPSYDSVLGPGGTEQDIAFMRTEAGDAYVVEPERVAVIVQGKAERAGVTKRFDWAFRRWYEVDDCPDESSGRLLSVLSLRGGDALVLRVEVRGEELFRAAPLEDAALQFDLFAQADADGDDVITLDELAEVDAPPLGVEPPFRPGPATTPSSFGDVVYGFLLPRITRLTGSGACKAVLDSRWW